MVHRHRTLLATFLWTVLLLAGTTSRLPAQEQTLGSVSEDDPSQAKTTEVVSLPEITGKTTPTAELQAPDLEQLLSHLEAFRKAHTPFHIRHREVIKLRNASEVEALESMGLPPGWLLDTEYESAFWDNRSWKRCLSRGVDGEPASDKRSSGDCEGTAGLDVPFTLLGVFIEPKPENCKLTFDDIFPHITITSDEHEGHIELWMFPVSGHWIPKRLRSTPEDKEEPVIEWEVHHIKAFGKDRPPQIIDGEVRWTVRNGDQETTITSEFFITKALYGDDVVPGEIDPSLAPMPAAAAAPVVDAQVMNTPAASSGPQLRARSPKVIVIETTPDIDRSEVIRKVVEAMENDGRAQRGDIERVGKPVGLEAILSPVHDMSHEKIIRFIEVLQSLGVDRMRFSANNEQKESTVIIQCPPDIAWRKVRTMTEELEKTGDFKVDVRVAASDEPVTPVTVKSLPNANRGTTILPGAEELPPPSNLQDGASLAPLRPAIETSERGEVKVFALQNIQANEAGRIIEQLYITTPGGHDAIAIRLSVDDHNNSLIVRGDSAVIAEVEALLLRLDTKQSEPNPADSSNAIGGDDAGIRVNVPALGPDPLAVDSSVPVRGDGQAFTFSLGFNGQSADDLQRQYDALEQRAQSLSDQLRKPLPDPATGETLRSQLRDTVRQAFETRQNLQRAELAVFARRLKGIQESIESRDKISQQIIDRRVEELLDPDLKWDSPETSSSGRAPALRSDSFPSSHEKATPDGSRRAATILSPDLSGDVSYTDAPETSSVADPSESSSIGLEIRAVPDETLTWNLMGVVFRTKVADRAPGASIPNPEDRNQDGQWLEAVHVQEGGPASRAGLAVGDLLISIDRMPIHTVDDISRAWQDAEPASPSTVHLMRVGQLLTTQLRWSSRMRQPLNVEGKVLTRTGDQLEVLLGADDGLKPGNRLLIRSVKAQPIFHSAEIVSVQADTSIARIVFEEKRFPIEAGDIASFNTGVFDPPPTASADDAPVTPPGTAAQPLKVEDKLEPKPQEKPVDDPVDDEEMRRPNSEPSNPPTVYQALNPQSPRTPIQDEKAISKLVLTFFQDRSRRAVPCVVLKINEEYFAVTTSPATVVPDGTPHAIDRSVVEWNDGSKATVTYDENSTKELQLYRFADDAVIPEPQRSAAEINSHAIPAVGFDARLEVGVPLFALTPVGAGSLSETRVHVSAINVSQKLSLPSHKVEHHYEGLFAVDVALPEGTPVFLDGKLMGLTILGSRFVGEEARQSYVFPASRLWEFCNKVP